HNSGRTADTKADEVSIANFLSRRSQTGAPTTLSGAPPVTAPTPARSISDPATNTYTVTETAADDFTPFGPMSCIAIVGAGQINTSCAFTDQAKGQIVVTKQVEGGNGSFTFSLTPGGSSIILSGGAAGTTVTLTGSLDPKRLG